MFSKSAVAAYLLTTVSAHQNFHQFWVNDISPGYQVAIRMPPSNSPVTDVTSNDITCNVNGNNVPSGVATAAANEGDSIKVQWDSSSHPGPITHFLMGPVSNASTTTGVGEWFKIDEFDSQNGTWANAIMEAQNMTYTFKLPTGLASGDYLLRSEMLALHGSQTLGGGQFYIGCAQLTITGTAGETCTPSIKLPGAYSETDSNIYIPNFYNGFDISNYTAPGGPVATCGAGTGAGTGSATAVVSSLVTSSSLVISSSVEALVASISSRPSVASQSTELSASLSSSVSVSSATSSSLGSSGSSITTRSPSSSVVVSSSIVSSSLAVSTEVSNATSTVSPSGTSSSANIVAHSGSIAPVSGSHSAYPTGMSCHRKNGTHPAGSNNQTAPNNGTTFAGQTFNHTSPINLPGLSTVYATSIYTVTSCAASVTNCPAKIGSLTTELVSLYTTNALIATTPDASVSVTRSADGAIASSVSEFVSSQASTTKEPESITKTVYATSLYTVTSCAASITDCPARMTSVRTSLSAISTTVIPNTKLFSIDSTSTALGESGDQTSASSVTTATQALITSIEYATSIYTISSGNGSQVTTEINPVSTAIIPVQQVQSVTSVIYVTSVYTETTGASSGQVVTASLSSATVLPVSTEYITTTVYYTSIFTVTTGVSSGRVRTRKTHTRTIIPAKPFIVYVTSVYTVTAGAASGQVTTESATSTTLMPVSAVVSQSAVGTPDSYTSVIYVTSVYTLTTGASSGQVTTESFASSTVVPVSKVESSPPESTASVIYITSIYTLTAGPSSGQATTEEIASTTRIPVSAAIEQTPSVSTIYITSYYTGSSGQIETQVAAVSTTEVPSPVSTSLATSELASTTTVYESSVYTISSAAGESSAPVNIGQVTTQLIPVSTVIVSPPASSTSSALGVFVPGPPEEQTLTVYATSVYTITSCAASITNCPGNSKIGQVTTELVPVSTTVIQLSLTNDRIPTGGAGRPPFANSTTIGALATGSASNRTLPAAPYGNNTFTRTVIPSVITVSVASTVYTTATFTVSSCAPSDAACNVNMGSLTTRIEPVSTTMVPTTIPASLASGGSISRITTISVITSISTSTVYTANVKTVSSCGLGDSSCSATLGVVVTEWIAAYTTICPVTATQTQIFTIPTGLNFAVSSVPRPTTLATSVRMSSSASSTVLPGAAASELASLLVSNTTTSSNGTASGSSSTMPAGTTWADLIAWVESFLKSEKA